MNKIDFSKIATEYEEYATVQKSAWITMKVLTSSFATQPFSGLRIQKGR